MCTKNLQIKRKKNSTERKIKNEHICVCMCVHVYMHVYTQRHTYLLQRKVLWYMLD